MSTIFARSSAPGKAGVTVYRVSGSQAMKVITSLTPLQNIEPNQMYFTNLFHPNSGQKIDEALICYFAAPRSFTGENVVEIYCHGSIAIEKLLTDAVLSYKDVRYAEAGEFARRAFLNNKIDLTRAEAMVDLIEAETVMQHSQAMRQMSGALEKLYSNWRSQLLQIMSLIEAYIDFPEEDIPPQVLLDAQDNIATLIVSINEHLSDERRGERLRSGLMMALLGHPNVGKSSLTNLLSQREVAIVSNIAGTTRDTLESHLDIGGYPIILMDTAGMVEVTDDIIEQEGVRRAQRVAIDADIKLIILDLTQELLLPEVLKHDLQHPRTILICNKVDLIDDREIPSKKVEIARALQIDTDRVVMLSVKHHQGIDELLALITNIAEQIAAPKESPSLTRQRHRVALAKAMNVLNQLDFTDELELVAEDIRIIIHHLHSLVGRIDVDEVLGEIFSSFCIGK